MIVVPNEGTGWLLERLKTVFNAGPLKIHLYQNDYYPVLDSIPGNFTEANFPGYGPINLFFDAPVAFDAQGHGFLLGDTVTWVSVNAPAADQRVYGYFVTNAASNTVIWAERFSKRLTIRKAGTQVIVSPRFGALTEFSG